MTSDLKVLRDPWRTWIIDWYLWFYLSILRDFERQVLQMVRVVNWEWLRYAICNMEPWLSHSWFYFLQTLFPVQEQVIKKSILLAYFRDLGKQNFYICDLRSSIFSVCELCQRPPPLYNSLSYNHYCNTFAKFSCNNLCLPLWNIT